jgi:hypothetical protein
VVRTPLDLKATTDFAEKCYGRERLQTGQSYRSHADDLMRTVDKLWKRHFHGTDFIMPHWREHMEWSQHACRMFALMSRFGQTFEDVNDVTNPNVASLLASISYDPRLPAPLRDLDLQSRVGGGGIAAQLITLGEISLTASAQSDWVRVLVEDPETSRESLEDAARSVAGRTAGMTVMLNCLHAIPGRGGVRQWLQEVDKNLRGVESYLKAALRTRPHIAAAKATPPARPKKVPTCPPPTLKPKISSGTCSSSSVRTETNESSR